ncbi:glycoside hydrolase family protein [Sphingomonas sp. QA11]|uniref:glycoside hydrolase family protein n=1 Tax=Sphingomonas sp. QA11 TaxID=2950605 RepID=UPI00234ABEB3|nr:glycoside hydrolase family protein [Sphingomonas sp. QA11]WCM29187.1 glycoside hydrolase family protein [Sphingomonas sp. QA11]
MTYDRAKLAREIARDEGDKLKVYRCTAGKLSIGKGRNLEDVGISAEETRILGITKASAIAKGITQAQSDALFVNDIQRSEADLDRKLPWWRKLDPVRQRVLLNMCFNMGIGRAPDKARGIDGRGLLAFVNTLPKIERGDYAGAAAGMKASKWHDQVGARAVRLELMMATGKDAT